MKKLMTKHFSKWASKQNFYKDDLLLALTEVQDGNFKALSKILFNLSTQELLTAITNGDIIEVKS